MVSGYDHPIMHRTARLFYRKEDPWLWLRRVEAHCTASSTLLEIGAGSGIAPQNTAYPSVGTVYGIDPDSRVLENPHLAQAWRMMASEINTLPADLRFDCIYSRYVAEHIEDGEAFLGAQLKRLKPDGVLVHSTVSAYHWTSLLNDLIPRRLKVWMTRNLGADRDDEDVFEAYYALNKKQQIARISQRLGCTFEIIRQDLPPGYLKRSFVLMFLYSLIHKPLQAIFPALRPHFLFIIRPTRSA